MLGKTRHYLSALALATMAAMPVMADTAVEAAPPAEATLQDGASAQTPQKSVVLTGWKTVCDEADAQLCEITNHALTEDTQEPVFGLWAAKSNGNALGTILLPLGTDVSQPVSVSVNGLKVVDTRVNSCQNFGCTAPLILIERDVNLISASPGATLSFMMADGGVNHIPLDGAGFADAWAEAVDRADLAPAQAEGEPEAEPEQAGEAEGAAEE